MNHIQRGEPVYFAPTKVGRTGWIAYKDSPSPPPAPDYTGAANATAEGNLEAAKYTTQANRADQTTPWGSVKWTQGKNADGTDNNQWTQDTTLTPMSQAALDAQLAVTNGKSQAANTLLGQVQNQISTPIDYSSAGTLKNVDGFRAGNGQLKSADPFQAGNGQYQNVQNFRAANSQYQNAAAYDPSQAQQFGKAAYDSQKALLDPQYAQQESSLRNNLALQGLSNTSEAYTKDMGNFYQAKDAAYNNLANQSLLTGNQLAQQNYQTSLSGINANNQTANDRNQSEINNYQANLAGVAANNQTAGAANQQAINNYQTGLSGISQNNQTAAAQNQQAISNYQTMLNGVNAQNQIHSNQMTELQAKYNTPINQLNALLTGSQVSQPQFASYAAQNQVAGPDLLGAATAQGNYDMNAYNAAASSASGANSGLGSMIGTLGGATITAF